MAQITIYLDDDTSRRAREAAATAGVSVSRWIAEMIRHHSVSEWPAGVAALAGSWSEIPTADELRLHPPDDLPRESL